MNHYKRNYRATGFTLVELIITITLVIVLVTLSLSGYQALKEKAKSTKEVNAARVLITAYLGYATDNNGLLLPGYQSDPTVTDSEGDPLVSPMNARYPWRLASIAPGIEESIVFNGNESVLVDKNKNYLLSVRPNLGLNAILVGGHFGSSSPLSPTSRIIAAYGKFYISHLSEAEFPDNLIVFSSARSGKNNSGYFEVRPPNLTAPTWSRNEFDEDMPANQHGFVDFRYNKRAVSACLAGNVQLLDEEQMRDMRRWSNQAAYENNRNFMISRRIR